jgi:hypothetical protein
MKHSKLYLGLVLPSGGWQSLIDDLKNIIDDSRLVLQFVASLTIVIYNRQSFIVQATDESNWTYRLLK